MSIGAPSNLGTLLIQRLDAVLGTTLSQQTSLVSGTGPQAVPQTGSTENPDALQNPAQRHPRESVDRTGQQGGHRAAVDKAQREIQLDNLLGRRTTFQGSTQSAPTTLGYAARIILALLHHHPQSAPAIKTSTPLLANPDKPQSSQASNTLGNPAGRMESPAAQAANTVRLWAQLATALNQSGALAARFSNALAQSVHNSGLFYESHLAQLAAGKLSAGQLRQEPQGQIPQLPAHNAGNATPAAPAGQPTGTAATLAQDPGASQSGAGPAPGTQQVQVPGVDPQAQPLVRHQLEVLANQGFAWQGEAWPDAPMEWEVHRRRPGEHDTPGFDGEHWSSSLKLHLPRLGHVHARISLAGDQLLLRLGADGDSVSILADNTSALRERLLTQGLQTSQLSVVNQGELPQGEDREQEHEDTI